MHREMRPVHFAVLVTGEGVLTVEFQCCVTILQLSGPCYRHPPFPCSSLEKQTLPSVGYCRREIHQHCIVTFCKPHRTISHPYQLRYFGSSQKTRVDRTAVHNAGHACWNLTSSGQGGICFNLRDWDGWCCLVGYLFG